MYAAAVFNVKYPISKLTNLSSPLHSCTKKNCLKLLTDMITPTCRPVGDILDIHSVTTTTPLAALNLQYGRKCICAGSAEECFVVLFMQPGKALLAYCSALSLRLQVQLGAPVKMAFFVRFLSINHHSSHIHLHLTNMLLHLLMVWKERL